jgi:hypothetical protein
MCKSCSHAAARSTFLVTSRTETLSPLLRSPHAPNRLCIALYTALSGRHIHVKIVFTRIPGTQHPASDARPEGPFQIRAPLQVQCVHCTAVLACCPAEHGCLRVYVWSRWTGGDGTWNTILRGPSVGFWDKVQSSTRIGTVCLQCKEDGQNTAGTGASQRKKSNLEQEQPQQTRASSAQCARTYQETTATALPWSLDRGSEIGIGSGLWDHLDLGRKGVGHMRPPKI